MSSLEFLKIDNSNEQKFDSVLLLRIFWVKSLSGTQGVILLDIYNQRFVKSINICISNVAQKTF